mgnify:CR=1 FL=1
MEQNDFLTLELLIQAINKIRPNWRDRLSAAKHKGAEHG